MSVGVARAALDPTAGAVILLHGFGLNVLNGEIGSVERVDPSQWCDVYVCGSPLVPRCLAERF